MPSLFRATDGSASLSQPVDPSIDRSIDRSAPSLSSRRPEYTAAVHAVNDRLIKRTLAAGGTCTGEHGIGSGKKKYLPLEFGQNTVDMMCTIKESLDPHNLLNPGKIIDIKVPID